MSNNLKSSVNGSPVKVEAKSVEQALVKAAGLLGLTQDELQYRVLKEETSRGLFSFFKNPVVIIEAWAKAKPQSSRGPAPRGRVERAPIRDRREERERYHDDDESASSSIKSEPLTEAQISALTEELKEFCTGICSRLAGEPVDVSTSVDDGRLVLNIDNDYIAQQISKNSKLAEALEHILRKKPRHLRQELPFRIFVDVSGVRRKREEELIQMAHDLSAKVHENKRPIVLNYKSSYDRKIIHMALDKDERVYTKSIGSGPNRKLMILPQKDAQMVDEPEIYEE